MKGFFSIDGKAYQIASVIMDICLVTLLWLACSIPVVTMGAATSAGYYVMTKRVANREGYVIRGFFKSFMQNLIPATILTVLLLLCGGVLLFNLDHVRQLGDIRLVLRPVYLFIGLELCFVTVYLFPLLSRFQMGLVELVKTAAWMANRHLLTSVTCLALMIGMVLVCTYVFFPFIIAAFGVYAFFTSHMLMRIFKQYRPELDTDEPPNNPMNKPGA